ncbi:MAG: OsmC family protein [Proteobacteria bacterium]|nr:OsmC family protein [Pseudomonadota bacterium]
MKITTKYQGGMRFAEGEGHSLVVMDAKKEVGGQEEALTPKELVLQGLAGCTGLDVAAMLDKKKVHYENFSIDVEAEQTKHHPKVFSRIHITYRIKAALNDGPTIIRMIELSKNNFCGVSAMLSKTAEMSWELDFDQLD